MPPGRYIPDATEGITRVEDLPRARVRRRSRNYRRRRCGCGRTAYRHQVWSRTFHDLSTVPSGRPLDLFVVYSKHRCPALRAELLG